MTLSCYLSETVTSIFDRLIKAMLKLHGDDIRVLAGGNDDTQFDESVKDRENGVSPIRSLVNSKIKS